MAGILATWPRYGRLCEFLNVRRGAEGVGDCTYVDRSGNV